MEIGGLVIAAVFVSLLATVPQLVERRMAIVESREIDRFSPSLRMIHMDASELDMCDRATGTILARRALTSGGSMHTVATGRTRPVIDRRNNKAVRDIARLRARRAARLAAEIAAGRRRMVMTGICALSMVILTIVIAATSIAWTWILVPIAALVASLFTSRVAAVRSQRASEREFAQLTKLRADVRGGRPASSAPKVRKAEATKASDEAVVAPRVFSSSAASASAPRADGAEPATQTGSVPSLVFTSRCQRPLRLQTLLLARGPSPRSPRPPTRRVIAFAVALSTPTPTCVVSRVSRLPSRRVRLLRPPRWVPAPPKRLSPTRSSLSTWTPSWMRVGPSRAADCCRCRAASPRLAARFFCRSLVTWGRCAVPSFRGWVAGGVDM